MKCLWQGCNVVVESPRKRCEVHAEQHRKRETVRQRQIVTIEAYWQPRVCLDCGVEFRPMFTGRAGPPRKRCPECWGKPKPLKPIPPCSMCGCLMVERRKVCSDCLPIHNQNLRDRYRPVPKPPVLCSVCGRVSKSRRPVCGLCGKAVRRREQARLRCFRERLFTVLVHDALDVEFLIGLLDSPCMYCGSADDITIEHVVPLIRGGEHSMKNVGPACRSCNSSKQNQLFSEWKPS